MKILQNNSNLDIIIKDININQDFNIIYINIINPNKIEYLINNEKVSFTINTNNNKNIIFQDNILENNIFLKGYFIRNCFICTPDELFKPIMKKSKSYNDIDLIKIDNNLFTTHLEDIKKYCIIFNLIIKNKIIILIEEQLSTWINRVYSDNNELLNFYNNELNKNKDNFKILNIIINTFTNQNINKKNIILVLKNLKNDIMKQNNSDSYIELINWLDCEFNRLINNKFILSSSNLTIKDKLKEQNKLNKIINLIVDEKIRPQIIIIENENKQILKTINEINKKFNNFNKLVNNQLYDFFNILYTENNIFIKNNFKEIKINNKIVYKANNKFLFLGKNEINYCNIIINIPDFNIFFK